LKYAQYIYIEKVEAGSKSTPRCFFKFANLRRNSSGYPSVMFLGGACALNTGNCRFVWRVFPRCICGRQFAGKFRCGRRCTSTVSLIQFEEETVERGIVAFWTRKIALGPRDISTNSEKDCVGCFLGFFHTFRKSRTSSLCSRVVTREIFRTIVEYLIYRRFLSFLKS
jgi:hypothetical protein